MQVKHTQTVATVGSAGWVADHAVTAIEEVILGGNTAGAMATISSGTMLLAGGNNITLSQDGNSVTVSAPTLTSPIAGADIASVGSATASGTATSQFAAEDHVHAGVPVAGISGGNTAGETGSRYGSVLFAGGNNITLSGATAAGGQTITISGAAAGGAAGSISAGTTRATLGEVVFSNSNALSFGIDGQTVTASYTRPVVSDAIRTVGSATGSGTNTSRFAADDHVHAGVGQFQISGNTSNTSNVVFGSLVLAGGNNVTLSQVSAAGAATITISAANETQTVPPIATAVKAVESSGSTGTVTRFAPEDHAHQGVAGWDVNGIASTFFGTQQLSAGAGVSIATGGNTSRGSAQIINLWSTATTVSGVATGNAVGANASRFALEGHQHGGVPTVSVVGNTAGNTTQGNLSLVLAGGPNVTLSGSTNPGVMTVSVSAAAGGGGGGVTMSQTAYPAWPIANALYTQIGNGSAFFYPMALAAALQFDRVILPIAVTVSTSSNSSHAGTLSMEVGIFTRNGNTLSSLATASRTQAWTNTSNNSLASLSGARHFSIGFTTTLEATREYWLGVWSRTSTANANWISLSNLGQSVGTAATSNFLGNFAEASNASKQFVLGSGHHSASSSRLHASAALADLRGTVAGWDRFPPTVVFASGTL
jgi:hypothetical protein